MLLFWPFCGTFAGIFPVFVVVLAVFWNICRRITGHLSLLLFGGEKSGVFGRVDRLCKVCHIAGMLMEPKKAPANHNMLKKHFICRDFL